MQETIVNKNKRFVPVAEYQRISGLSYQTVMHMIRTKQISAIQTEGGHYKIDTQDTGDTDAAAIVRRLDGLERQLGTLCKHLGIAGGGTGLTTITGGGAGHGL